MALTDYLGGAAQDGSNLERMCGGFNLTRMQRFYGFGICFVAGFVVSILSTILLSVGSITGFAVLYTLGNVISLVSTGFLVGFITQFKLHEAPWGGGQRRWFGPSKKRYRILDALSNYVPS
ncbi:hypothetical protein HDV00_001159 [Rhizophlyctis rosea]|nr:hypothetical protein HDV00_001159 [Rhizophlyctis rosea]